MKIINNIQIPDNEIEWHFIRSSGPGGQKVNKIETAAQLRFNIKKTNVLSEPVKTRLFTLVGNRVNSLGELIITGRRYRTQKQNREDALARLAHFIMLALHEPKMRKKTTVSQASKEKRLTDKRRRSEAKRRRKPPMDF